jgi:ubiquinone biosynthesis protein
MASLYVKGVVRNAGGLGDLFKALSLLIGGVGFVWVLASRRLFGRPLSPREIGIRLRRVCEKQGLIYCKLGQYLTIRADLLHPDIRDELTHLYNAVAPMPFEEVRRILERELGAPILTLFAEIDHKPVGSASVAQVHRAVTCDGQVLALKVQRSSVRRDFPSDSRNFLRIARLCDLLSPVGRTSIQDVVREFIDFTSREIDFQLEGRAADRLRSDLEGGAYVPRIRWNLTTSRVLAMEYIEGTSLLTLCRLAESGRADEIGCLMPNVDIPALFTGLANACFRQFFETGFFHGDPHPANIIVRPDNSFVFIDCGIFGELDLEDRRNLRAQVAALAEGRYSDSAESFMRMCCVTAKTNLVDWKRDLTSAMAFWHRIIQDRDGARAFQNIGQWQGRIIQTLNTHHVFMRPNFMLLWRAMGGLEVTALRVPKYFNLQQAMSNYFRARQPVLPAFEDVSADWARVASCLADSMNRLSSSSRRRDTPTLTLRFVRVSGRERAHAFGILAVCTFLSLSVVVLLRIVPSEQSLGPFAILTGLLLLLCMRGGWAQ